MRDLFSTFKNHMAKQAGNRMANQDGSMILIAILLLMLMTVIGISATQTSVTESFILRNTAIHTQNINLIESAALQIAEDALLDVPEPPNTYLAVTGDNREPYILPYSDWNAIGANGKSLNDEWYSFGTGGAGRILTGTGTTVPDPKDPTNNTYLAHTNPNWVAPSFVGETTLTGIRGENLSSCPVRVALVGWESAPGSSLKATKTSPKRGKVVAEYISPKYGMIRLEIGVEREF